MRFYNYKDGMVRTSVSTIILAIMKIDDPRLKQYLGRFPFLMYFVHFSCHMNHLWRTMDEIILEDAKQHRFRDMLDDQIDTIFMIEDLFNSTTQQVNAVRAHLIFRGAPASISLT